MNTMTSNNQNELMTLLEDYVNDDCASIITQYVIDANFYENNNMTSNYRSEINNTFENEPLKEKYEHAINKKSSLPSKKYDQILYYSLYEHSKAGKKEITFDNLKNVSIIFPGRDGPLTPLCLYNFIQFHSRYIIRNRGTTLSHNISRLNKKATLNKHIKECMEAKAINDPLVDMFYAKKISERTGSSFMDAYKCLNRIKPTIPEVIYNNLYELLINTLQYDYIVKESNLWLDRTIRRELKAITIFRPRARISKALRPFYTKYYKP